MAYGQKISGKIFDMFGRVLLGRKDNMVMKKYESENDIVQRVIIQIFDYKNKAKNSIVTSILILRRYIGIR